MELAKINQNQSVQVTHSLDLLKTYLDTIPDTAPEKNILAVKYSAPPFLKMSAAEILKGAGISLLKIAIITGWELPSREPLDPREPKLTAQSLLIDQLTKHLKETYLTVNVNEIEFAFRQYGSTVKDWGKTMNLNLFDQVMMQYMTARREASEIERNRPVEKPVALIESPVMTNQQKIEKGREMWEGTRKVDFIFPYTFQALVDEKLIKYPMDAVVQARYWKKAETRMLEHEANDHHFFRNKNREEWKKVYCRKLVCADYFNGDLEED